MLRTEKEEKRLGVLRIRALPGSAEAPPTMLAAASGAAVRAARATIGFGREFLGWVWLVLKWIFRRRDFTP